MSRSYDESLSELSGALERYPGAALTLGYAAGSWLAMITADVPYAGPDGETNSEWAGSRALTFQAQSCEAEKVLDSLASKVTEAGL